MAIDIKEIFKRFPEVEEVYREEIHKAKIAAIKHFTEENLQLQNDLKGAQRLVWAAAEVSGGMLEIPIKLIQQFNDDDHVMLDIDEGSYSYKIRSA